MKINADEWDVSKTIKLATEGKSQLRLRYSSSELIELTVTRASDGVVIPIDQIVGTGEKVYDLTGVIAVEAKSKKEFAYSAKFKERQVNEPHNHETPPPPPKPNNLLQRLRNESFRTLVTTREQFGQGYEIDDDDMRTTDELLDDAAQEAEKKAAQAKADQVKTDQGDPPAGDSDISEAGGSPEAAQAASQ